MCCDVWRAGADPLEGTRGAIAVLVAMMMEGELKFDDAEGAIASLGQPVAGQRQ